MLDRHALRYLGRTLCMYDHRWQNVHVLYVLYVCVSQAHHVCVSTSVYSTRGMGVPLNNKGKGSTFMYTHKYMAEYCTSIHTYVHTYVSICVCTYVYTCMYVCTYVCVCTYVYVQYLHTYVLYRLYCTYCTKQGQLYVHTYIRMYTCTNVQYA